jgi:hypothetical protein
MLVFAPQLPPDVMPFPEDRLPELRVMGSAEQIFAEKPSKKVAAINIVNLFLYLFITLTSELIFIPY